MPLSWANSCELMAIRTRPRYRVHRALYERSPTARYELSAEHFKAATHVCKDSVANLVVLFLDLFIVQVPTLEVGDDLETLGVLIRVDEVAGRLGADEAAHAQDDAANDLDRQGQPPRPVRLDVAARVIDPDRGTVADNVARKLECAEEAAVVGRRDFVMLAHTVLRALLGQLLAVLGSPVIRRDLGSETPGHGTRPRAPARYRSHRPHRDGRQLTLSLVDRDDHATNASAPPSLVALLLLLPSTPLHRHTHLSMPTPQPETNRPNTMTAYPLQNVWKQPPMEKKTAPRRIVMRRPSLSARVAAARDVTVGHVREAVHLVAPPGREGLTERSDLEHGDHAAPVSAEQ